MKKLSKRRKYLGTIFSSHIPSKDGQYLPQKPSKEAKNNVSISKIRFTNGKANSQVPYKVKIKTSNKKRYKIY